MRTVFGVLALTVGLTVGCTRLPFLKGPEPRPPVSGETPPVAAIVNYLDENSRRIQTVRCMDVDLTCSKGLQSFGLRGKMMTQKPRNFLMSCDLLGNRAVDVGSNDQEFWYWISKDNPPNQVYCSYKDLSEGRVKHMPFPFQPEWIMETMGLGSYGPADRYRLEPEGNNLKLIEQSRSPQGTPARKVIVMNRRPMQPPTPQVTAFLLQDDANGKEICSAHISEIQVDHATGAVLPRRIEFRWPEQRFKMAMKLDGIAVNAEVPATAFVRRPLQGVPSYNLANGRLEQAAADIQPVQNATR